MTIVHDGPARESDGMRSRVSWRALYNQRSAARTAGYRMPLADRRGLTRQTPPPRSTIVAMKFLGACALLVGLVTLAFAVMTHREFRRAATSESLSADSMRLTRIVAPELFDPGFAGGKPSELVSIAINRIYLIGAAALLCVTCGLFMLLARPAPLTPPRT